MLITTLVINVARSAGNRGLVMELFSFADVFFILEPPAGPDGGFVQAEDGVYDLFSFVKGSGVEAFVRSSLVGLFDLVRHGDDGAAIGYFVQGTRHVMGGVYIRPMTDRAGWDRFEEAMASYSVLAGDFNARLPGLRLSGAWVDHRGKWMSDIMDRHDYTSRGPDVPTFRGISTIDHCISKRYYDCKCRYTSKAGLEHDGLIVKIHADPPPDLRPRRPDWPSARRPALVEGLKALSTITLGDRWKALRSIVNDLPRKREFVRKCRFWSDELDRMRLDM